ncbi:MAG: YifB family Mg chelatase-like AAA ATPase [Patescibacteria group bacterium]|nr:YifB family Mg chelatase-like AAA ATPase [Patescibacteria group bacterium]
MPSKVYSATIIGLNAQIIEVEVDTSYGLRHFEIVGLPDKAVQESKERVGTAIKSSDFCSPFQQPIRVLVNLAPADLKKEGSMYDLPIALGYLLASKQIKFYPNNKIILGELSLDGKLRPIKGALSFALTCKEKDIPEIILPNANAQEAGMVKGLKVIGVESLKETINYLTGKKKITPLQIKLEDFLKKESDCLDIGWIKGQGYAKRALEIAAAGSHNLLMTGPPGAGKTLLSKSIPSILPQLTFEESLEITKIYSVAGFLPERSSLITQRPFRSPHHTSSEAALIGGGNPPRVGEITLAHRGVLFLDEFPEFHRNVLESLRQPIEDGKISILRAKHRQIFPARFMLIAASNPCPCGYYGDPEKKCTCSPSQIAMYRRKLSGPLMDRIDLFISVPQLKYDELIEPEEKKLSIEIKEKVNNARQKQKQRFEKEKGLVNSEMDIPQIKKYCQVDSKSQSMLKKYINDRKLSARGYHRVLKIARTIADLEGLDDISFDCVSEATMYRMRENE